MLPGRILESVVRKHNYVSNDFAVEKELTSNIFLHSVNRDVLQYIAHLNENVAMDENELQKKIVEIFCPSIYSSLNRNAKLDYDFLVKACYFQLRIKLLPHGSNPCLCQLHSLRPLVESMICSCLLAYAYFYVQQKLHAEDCPADFPRPVQSLDKLTRLVVECGSQSNKNFGEMGSQYLSWERDRFECFCQFAFVFGMTSKKVLSIRRSMNFIAVVAEGGDALYSVGSGQPPRSSRRCVVLLYEDQRWANYNFALSMLKLRDSEPELKRARIN